MSHARRDFPNHIKLSRWRHCGQRCECCGNKIIGTAEYDHEQADGLGGEPTFENCRVLCQACHSAKTHGHDNPIMTKADRQARKHLGLGRKKRWRWG